MTENKRFTCETKTQGSVSIDLMKDNGQIIEKFEAINLLNELNDKNKFLSDFRGFITMEHQKIKEENEELKQVLGSILLEVKKDIINTSCTGEIKVFINPNSFNLISDVLRKYGALKEWYE